MSGFEIAGIVLGIIPLVISAVEHYEDVTDPLKVFLRFNGEVGKVIRELGNLRTSYELSLKVVLKPIVNDQELIEIMEDPDSELWQDPGVDDSLRNSLGDAYSSYRRTTEDIGAVMFEILKSLNIQDFDRTSGDRLQEALIRFTEDGKTSKFQIKDRFKYSKTRRRIKSQLEDIRKYITLLDSYETKATKIAAQGSTTTPSRFNFTFPLQVHRSNAAKLYDVISKSWCSSHSSHSAGLLLEQRIVARKKGRQQSKAEDAGRFEILVSQAPLPRTKWHDVEFRLMEEVSIITSQKKYIFPYTSSHVLISYRIQVQVMVTTIDPGDSIQGSLPYENPTQLQIVEDLCEALQSHCYPFLGFCFDHMGSLRGAYEAQRTKPVIYHDDSLSFCDLIERREYHLPLRDKYTLSITLASALLQLSSTPWLYGTWNTSDIIFLRTNDNQQSRIPVDISHPYIVHEHRSSDSAQMRQQLLPEKDSSKILSLGVMLVEILNNQPIESIYESEDLGQNNKPNQLTNFQAIKRWLEIEESCGNISLSYFDAIQYCLECFAKPKASLSDEDFAKTVQVKILVPLLVEMNSMFGQKV